jgi:hypothetical protein
MKIKKISRYFATPAKIVMSLFIILFAVICLQIFALATSIAIEASRQRESQEKLKEKKPVQLTDQQKRIKRISNSAEYILPDGSIHLIYTPNASSESREKGKERVIYDVNDQIIWQGRSVDIPFNYLDWGFTHYGKRHRDGISEMERNEITRAEMSRTFEVTIHWGDKMAEIWRYDPVKKYFTRYKAYGKSSGYLGADGFTLSKSQVKPFGDFREVYGWVPEDTNVPQMLWQTENRLYEIDFVDQRADLLFESFDKGKKFFHLFKWTNIEPSPSKEPKTVHIPAIGYIIGNRHHLLIKDTDERVTVTVPEEWSKWYGNSVRFTVTTDGIFMRRNWTELNERPEMEEIIDIPENFKQWWDDYSRSDKKKWVEFYKVSGDGSFELVNSFNWTEPGNDKSNANIWKEPLVMPYVSSFSPLMGDLAVRAFKKPINKLIRKGGNIFGASLQAISYFRPTNIGACMLVSLLMVLLAFWHGWPRRVSLPEFLSWLIFVGLFNVAGLCTYLALNHRPVIKCPLCGKQRGLGRVDCVRCGKQLPRPEQRKVDLIFSA